MSKPLSPGQMPVHLEVAQQVRRLADLYRNVVNPASQARLAARVRELGLEFSDDELLRRPHSQPHRLDTGRLLGAV